MIKTYNSVIKFFWGRAWDFLWWNFGKRVNERFWSGSGYFGRIQISIHSKSFNSDPVNPYGVRFDMKGRTRIGSILDILVKITILTILLSIKYYNLLSLSYFSILGHMAYIELDFRKTTYIRIGQNIYCHKIFHNSVLHRLKYIFAVY